MTKTTILFQCTENFKDAVGTFAQKQKMSQSELIRVAVASYIDYDLTKDPIVDGRRKYASIEERKEVQAEKQRRDRRGRQAVSKLLEVLAREQRLFDVASIEASLLKKGIKLDD